MSRLFGWYPIGVLVRDAVDGETNFFEGYSDAVEFLYGSSQQEPTILMLWANDKHDMKADVMPLPRDWSPKTSEEIEARDDAIAAEQSRRGEFQVINWLATAHFTPVYVEVTGRRGVVVMVEAKVSDNPATVAGYFLRYGYTPQNFDITDNIEGLDILSLSEWESAQRILENK